MTQQWNRTANLKRSTRELSPCASRQIGGSGLKCRYKVRAHSFGGVAKQRTSRTNIFGDIVTPFQFYTKFKKKNNCNTENHRFRNVLITLVLSKNSNNRRMKIWIEAHQHCEWQNHHYNCKWALSGYLQINNIISSTLLLLLNFIIHKSQSEKRLRSTAEAFKLWFTVLK